MTNLAHIVDTALLLLVAYVGGCVVGYAARRILYAARGTRQPTVVVAPPMPLPEAVVEPPKRLRTPAARLAAAGSREPLPLPLNVETQAPLSLPPAVRPAARPRRKPPHPKPVALSAPRGGQADNLKQIKGIGPKIEASLNGMGIYHIDQIAAWTKANVDWIDGQLAFKGRIRREQWVEQASSLTNLKLIA